MTAPSTTLFRFCLPALALATVGTVLLSSAASSRSADKKSEPRLAHMVFFTLKDSSATSRQRFVASCHKYLSGHEGVVFFAVGTIAEDVVEPEVSVRDFDVSLHLVFESKDAEAKYLKDPRHLKFVEENKALFGKVRVFDSYVPQP
jgi:Stress responsive A/B Barrel Domain